MKTFRIALGQINATVGALSANTRKIKETIAKARKAGASLVIFPELAISGYPPEDLLLKPAFIQACRKSLHEIILATEKIIVIVGFPEHDGDLYNAAAVISNQTLVKIYRKHFLPNYGVFDENRYFSPSKENYVFDLKEIRFGVSICEDIWYPTGPHEAQAVLGNAELLVNLSASPYHSGKTAAREQMLAMRAVDSVAAIAYCNLVGGQDELVFDGGSAVFDSNGRLLARGKQFQEDLVMADIGPLRLLRHRLFDPRRRKEKIEAHTLFQTIALPFEIKSNPLSPLRPAITKPLKKEEEVYQALVLGTKDYIRKNNFQKTVVGLSGGIDSSLVACIAVDALGPSNVTGVFMPSRFSSEQSRDDAAKLANSLKINFLCIPIQPIYETYLRALQPFYSSTKTSIVEENLQSRIRGTLLMALSNKFGWLVLTTGNKSELSVGYATLYGDMAGGFGVIKDVPKVLVYELAQYRNSIQAVIPERVFTKPPSAELRPNQKDTDSLPEYPVLDPILKAYIEQNWSLSELLSDSFPPETVKQVVKMVDRAEYKRRQAPPGIKITPRALGKDWRLPLTNQFAEEEK